MHVQSCCFGCKTYCFMRFSSPSASLDLKSPYYWDQHVQVCVYTMPDSFPCRHVNLDGTIRTTTVRKWNKYTHIKHRTERLAERVWCTWSQSSLLDIYFRFSRFQSSLLLIYFRYGPKRTHLFTLWRRVVKHTEITVLVCEQKPFSLWFLCGRKSYPVSV